MDAYEQRMALKDALAKVIDRHIDEFDSTKDEIIGVIDSLKMECFRDLTDQDEYSIELEDDDDTDEEE
jgi:hypothetical protein